MTYKIPKEVLEALEKLEGAGYEAYLVGGCVRDTLLSREPNDWDITTNARPEEIQKVFEKTFYENDFGTVGVVTESDNPALKVIEITPYRMEAKYTDKRHPDIIRFADKLEEDLKRRDFTVNAIALNISPAAYVSDLKAKETGEIDEKFVKIIDLWKGKEDLEKKIIKTVGVPKERFEEDALRLMRAVRLAAELKFSIDKETQKAISEKAHLLRMISKERIRDEFSKIIMSDNPREGVQNLQKFGILKYAAPEIEEGMDITQNKEHIYTVWEHNLRALSHAAEKKYPMDIRMAALLHDVGKPRTKVGDGPDSTFYNHEVVGAKIVAQVLSNLRYPKNFIEKVIKLVRWHLFFSDTEVITLSAVRRVTKNVGPENIWDLMKVRFCDRVGMGRPKEEPYRLRKYESMVEEALRSPLSVSMLKINGAKIMEITKLQAGPKIGYTLHTLFEEVLDDPALNTEEYLEKRAKELCQFSDEKLQELGTAGKHKKEEEESKEISKIRQKYGVR
ncbi:MAG: HD domain-containing protein [bacterium]|nr:HD domain-containing protein [bacterium]